MKGHNDVPATQEKTYLKWYNKIGYGSGDVGGNVVYAFLSAFVMIYLTDAVGLNPGIIGTLIIQSLTTTILTRGIAPEVTLVFKAVVIIGVALIQSEDFRKTITTHLKGRKTERA